MLEGTKYSLRKKFFKLIGGEVEIFDESENLVLFVHQKGFKLKEAIHVYSDKTKSQELFSIKARSIIDFGATYDVTEAGTEKKLGALKRKGLKSILKDEWEILDENDLVIGKVTEDSALMATLRRFLTSLIPQNYDGFIGETYVADFKQNFNPFLYKLNIDFSHDTQKQLERRLGISMAILLALIEGKQS
jgi:hypothetical protein